MLIEEHAAKAWNSLDESAMLLSLGDDEAGSEKVKEAAFQAITAVAHQRGWKSDSEDALFDVVERLDGEEPKRSFASSFINAKYYSYNGYACASEDEAWDELYTVREFVECILKLVPSQPAHAPARDGLNAESCAAMSRDFMADADRRFADGDAAGDSENLWKAAACAVIAVSLERGWSFDSYADMLTAVERLGREDGSPDFAGGFLAARMLSKNYRYEYLAAKRDTAFWRPAVHSFVGRTLKMRRTPIGRGDSSLRSE